MTSQPQLHLRRHLRQLIHVATFIVMAMLVGAKPATAQTIIDPTLGPSLSLDDVGSGELLCRRGDLFFPLPLLGMEVGLDVTEFLVRGRVEQVFHNPSAEVIEAVYVFPLPEGAAVDDLEMRIGERRIHSEIHEKVEAKKIYTEAKSTGRKAALLEQERPNLFTVSVANINPGENVTVLMQYIDELRFESGGYRLAFPLTFTPRYTPSALTQRNPILPVSHSASGNHEIPSDPNEDDTTQPGGNGSSAGEPGPEQARHEMAAFGFQDLAWKGVTPPFQPTGAATAPRAILSTTIHTLGQIEDIHSISHDIQVVSSDEDTYAVTTRQKTIVADRDFVLDWRPEVGKQPEPAAYLERLGDDDYLLMRVHAPETTAHPIPTETLFVVDVSGSMDGPSIVQARKALTRAVERLVPGDSFNLLWFNNHHGSFAPSFVPLDERSREQAIGWIGDLRADGGTEIYGALTRSLELCQEPKREEAHRRIVFLTDGAVSNEQQVLTEVARRRDQVRIHTLGIGHAPNRYLMRELAEEGRGLCELLGGTEPVGPRLDSFLARINRPALTELELHGLPKGASMAPSTLPDLYPGQPLHVSIRLPNGYSNDKPFEITGRRAGGNWSATLPVAQSKDGSGVAVRWARNEVDRWMSALHHGGPADEVREEVTRLGLDFRLVTAYTSFVAVDDQPTAEGLAQRAPVPNALPVGSTLGGSLPRGGTDDLLWKLISIICIATGTALFYWQSRAFAPTERGGAV